MMKVFVITEYVGANQNSTGYFWSKIIERLGMELGEISIIFPGSPGENAIFEIDMIKEIPFRSPRFNKDKLFFRVFGQIIQSLIFCKKIFTNVRRDDVVLSGTNPAFLLVLFPLLKRIIGFKWVLLVHDVFPENLVPAGIVSVKNPGYRVLSGLFSSIYSSADKLVVIGRDMEELISRKIGRSDGVHFISNWACDKEIYPILREEAPFIREIGWSGKTVFQFFGNIGRLQGVENILAAIKLVESEGAAFIFIGSGALVGKVEDFILNNPNKNIAYVGPVPLCEKNAGLAACDVALVSLEKGMLGLGVPSKAYFSMAADKPLLAVMENDAEISRVIREMGVGWQCEPGDPSALAHLIDSVCQSSICNLKGLPRSVIQDKYSEKNALDGFTVCVKALLVER